METILCAFSLFILLDTPGGIEKLAGSNSLKAAIVEMPREKGFKISVQWLFILSKKKKYGQPSKTLPKQRRHLQPIDS